MMVHAATGKAQSTASWVWGVSDILRGTYKPIDYRLVILPFTILRRMDCVMQPPTGPYRASRKPPYDNKSGITFAKLVDANAADQAGLLKEFTDGFSHQVLDIFENFDFTAQVARLEKAGLLSQVIARFASLNLDLASMPNDKMGGLFEALIRQSNVDSPGEDFTPRDVVRLLASVLLRESRDALEGASYPAVEVYDPTAGTGGLLTEIEAQVHHINSTADVTLFGQEINAESYAICKADVAAKGANATNIQLGNTLTEDKHANRTFQFIASNPPYGVDWKAHYDEVTGQPERFPAGFPRKSDGQMLFLQHVVSKMKKPTTEGATDGGRACIVMSGSPLFNGAAGSGESEIRRWLLEHDLVEAIIALPSGLFQNTGIGTYIWVLDNTKRAERRGKVQLIDARDIYSKMRKNVGDKNREMTVADRQRVLDAYDAFEDADPDISKVFATDAFGYWTITTERPVEMRYDLDAEAVGRVAAAVPGAVDVTAILAGRSFASAQALADAFGAVAKERGLSLKPAEARNGTRAVGRPVDEASEVAYAGTSLTPKPITEMENVPFGYGGHMKQADCIRAFMEAEVLPFYAGAVDNESKTKVGYEIPFTRQFYKHVPPRSLAEIDADLNRLAREIMAALMTVEKS